MTGGHGPRPEYESRSRSIRAVDELPHVPEDRDRLHELLVDVPWALVAAYQHVPLHLLVRVLVRRREQ